MGARSARFCICVSLCVCVLAGFQWFSFTSLDVVGGFFGISVVFVSYVVVFVSLIYFDPAFYLKMNN